MTPRGERRSTRSVKVRVRGVPPNCTVEWNNAEARQYTSQQMFLGAFWLFWAPVTIFVTTMLFDDGPSLFLLVWLAFGWIGTLLIPMQLVTAFAVEQVHIDAETVRHRFRGLPVPRRTFRTEKVTSLRLDMINDESVVTLNLYAGRSREMIAYTLAPSAKREVFRVLGPILEEVQPDIVLVDHEGGRGDR